MSTYTDLHLRKKENLTILRMPGNPYDGITPQRVIFENPENIYNGKFIGELSTTSASFSDVQLNDCTVIGGVLSNVAFKFGNDEELDLATLTSNISEMSENINSLQNFQTSAEISCQNLSLNLNKLGLSVEQLSANVNDLSNSLNIAIDHIDALSDSISNAISSNEDLSNALSNLSIDFNNYVISSKQSISTISHDLSGLSDEFIDYVDLNDKSISTISHDLSGLSDEFVSYREDTDDKIDSLQKQIQGGLTYQQSLLIDNNIYDYTLSHLFIENGIESYSILSIGYFYIAQTQPEHRINSYIYDGVELEHGDWLLITKNCYVSSMTSNDVNVLNAQDFDSFKLNDDNIALGNNEFNGNTIFNGDISSFGTAIFQNGLTSNSISSKSLSVDIADIKHLNIELSNIDYGISSLQDLSNDIYHKIVNAQNTANDATNTANSAIISVQCFSNELSNKADISSISTGYLMSNDVNISYHDHTIWLSAQTYVTSVDCTDFIKDGMLSTVELCGTMLIMNFNIDAGSDPISVDLSNFVDNYDGKISSLSNAIDSKIFISNKISGISGYSDLSIIKLPIDEYAVLLSTGNALSNALYVIEDNYIDAYGQQIKNVALPTDLSDAATKGYVDDSISNISIPTDLSDLTNSPGFLVSNDLSDYCYAKNETCSAIEISAGLSGKADKSQLANYELKADMQNDVSSIVTARVFTDWVAPEKVGDWWYAPNETWVHQHGDKNKIYYVIQPRWNATGNDNWLVELYPLEWIEEFESWQPREFLEDVVDAPEDTLELTCTFDGQGEFTVVITRTNVNALGLAMMTDVETALSSKADISSTVLNPIYDGNGEQFSEWTYVGLNYAETVISMTDNEDGTWTLITSEREYTDYQQTSPTLVNFDDEVTATRTENHVIGYKLGTQNDKPLQPQLSSPQISAIDSVVDERATYVKYQDGTISSFNIVGELSSIPNKENASEVKIRNTVTSIGTSVFCNCSELTSVTIGNSVTSIENGAFFNCSSLTSVSISDSVMSIGENVFHGCSELMRMTIPDSVMSIGEDAFYNCTNLANITVVGKTQAQAEALLSNANIPLSIVTTWNDASQEWVKDQHYILSSDASKVFIKNPSVNELSNGAKSDLSVIKLTTEEYAQILSSHEGAQPNALYVISSNNINAYGQNIKNVAQAVDLSDAVNLEQLSNAMSSIDLSNYLDKRVGGEVSGGVAIVNHDFKVLSGNYVQTIDGVDMYGGKNAFIQADTYDATSYGKSSVGSKGFYVLSVIGNNKLKLSGDISIPSTAYSRLWSVSLGNTLNSQFSTISSVDGQIVTFKSPFNSTIQAISISSESQLTALIAGNDNAFYCPSDVTLGNVVLNFYGQHAEGGSVHALAQYSHAEGRATTAEGRYSHAEGGNGTTAGGVASHAEGFGTKALGNRSHSEGSETYATMWAAHAEGHAVSAFGSESHAEGYKTVASNDGSHAEGYNTVALCAASHAEGCETYSYGIASHTEGYQTSATQYRAHAEGQYTLASGPYSHSEGLSSSATNNASHAEGQETIASGKQSHAEGFKSQATAEGAHAEGGGAGVRGGIASGIGSHAEGRETNATAAWAHAEGCKSQATAEGAHAEGGGNGLIGGTATGYGSHAEGYNTQATGNWAHAEGHTTVASGIASHSSGIKANALHDYSYVWNGNSSASISSINTGTFKINPVSGISGFYVGSQNLNDIIDNKTSNANVEIKNIIANALSSAGILANTQLSDITLGNVISAMYNLCQSMS